MSKLVFAMTFVAFLGVGAALDLFSSVKCAQPGSVYIAGACLDKASLIGEDN